ncbi:unnamed protein product [Onchocerca ochengi]|uniref:Annexin n=1 Tax=Onchocerca ochengi TaxID=42157 RepID=A0A182EXD6_ONCOC|nr:unnamed protein product [Onchocerca ochengi]
MMTPSDYDARQLHHAISGIGTKEKILIEIICSRTNDEIHRIKEKYRENYGNSLEDDVEGDTSGHFKRLLIALLQGNRNESMNIDYLKANQTGVLMMLSFLNSLISKSVQSQKTVMTKFIFSVL